MAISSPEQTSLTHRYCHPPAADFAPRNDKVGTREGNLRPGTAPILPILQIPTILLLTILKAGAPEVTPTPCATAHPFLTLYLTSRAASLWPRPNARRQPKSEYRVHRVRVITVNRCHRTWSQMRLWRTARRIPLHRWLSQRSVISPVPHRPVRRVSPPLREGRPLPPACPVLDTGSFRRKSKMRLWRVADAPLAYRNPGGAGHGAVSTRKPRSSIRKNALWP